MLCLALTMTLVVAVKAQVHEDCLSLFSEAVGELASTDQACSTTLAQLTSETTECTDDVKKSIDECLDVGSELNFDHIVDIVLEKRSLSDELCRGLRSTRISRTPELRQFCS